MTDRYVLEHRRGLGDAVAMTAAVRDFKLANPDAAVAVITSFDAVWQNNPYVSPVAEVRPGAARRVLAYNRVLQPLRLDRTLPRRHLLEAYHELLRRLTGRPVPLTLPRPDLHLGPADRRPAAAEPPYWVVVAGIKEHITVKQWPVGWYQRVVDRLAAAGVRCVQVGAVGSAAMPHRHPRLRGAVDLVGRTTVRELFALVRDAAGVLCPITSVMHVAAAFDVPAVVVAGGREDPWWEHYADGLGTFHGATGPVRSPHVLLHTVGRLDCCRSEGCNRPYLTQNPRGTFRQTALCLRPGSEGGTPVAECMRQIPPDLVVESVLSCNAGQKL